MSDSAAETKGEYTKIRSFLLFVLTFIGVIRVGTQVKTSIDNLISQLRKYFAKFAYVGVMTLF